jgi:beta-phosphoglucomutase-like phosphatase (HAD superfamily)
VRFRVVGALAVASEVDAEFFRQGCREGCLNDGGTVQRKTLRVIRTRHRVSSVRAIASTMPRLTPPLLPPDLVGMRPAALLLDFDGVILDSVAIKIDAYLQIYADEDPEKLKAIFDHQRTHGGVTRRVKFRYFETEVFGRPTNDEAIETLSAAFTRLVHDAVLACPFIPGAREFLDCVHGNADMHIISGTPREELQDVVKRRGLAPYFASLHGAPATKLGAFREILVAGCYPPRRVLAIGDAVTELEAATSLGIPFLGVSQQAESATFPPNVPVVSSLAGVGEALGFA